MLVALHWQLSLGLMARVAPLRLPQRSLKRSDRRASDWRTSSSSASSYSSSPSSSSSSYAGSCSSTTRRGGGLPRAAWALTLRALPALAASCPASSVQAVTGGSWRWRHAAAGFAGRARQLPDSRICSVACGVPLRLRRHLRLHIGLAASIQPTCGSPPSAQYGTYGQGTAAGCGLPHRAARATVSDGCLQGFVRVRRYSPKRLRRWGQERRGFQS